MNSSTPYEMPLKRMETTEDIKARQRPSSA
jgi:hypothetical protein